MNHAGRGQEYGKVEQAPYAHGPKILVLTCSWLAFVFQGLVNRADRAHPAVLFNAGYINYDWPVRRLG